jgi:hypothetical protein
MNKKRTTLANLLLALAWTISATSCYDPGASGEEEVDVRDISGFTEISAGGGVQVTVEWAHEPYVEVTAPGRWQRSLTTEVRGDVLHIGFRNSFLFNRRGSVLVRAPRIDAVHASGGSEVRLRDRIDEPELEIRASGGSDVSGEVAADRLTLRASGGAEIVLSGSASTVTARASSGSTIRGYELRAGRAELRASSGAGIRIRVTEELDGRASSGGSIRYAGSPGLLSTETSSGGSISPDRD